MTDENQKTLAAPRVTPADLEANIVSEHFFTAANGAAAAGYVVASDDDCLRTLTICVLGLKNGFTLVGTNHGSAAVENFDAALGRKYARENAVAQMWPLMGYELKSRLAAEVTQ